MRWWFIALVLVLVWWLFHRHLTRRARKLGLPGLGGLGHGAGPKPPCGCGGTTPAGGPLPSSPTASGNQTLPTSAGGTLPSNVDEENGPAAIAAMAPDMGIFQ